MNIWLVRHGEREDKLENRNWTGGCDPGLTRAGVGQAQFTGARLKGESIDYMYCSPFYRTVLTAVEISAVLGLRCRVEEGLSEALLPAMYQTQPRLDPVRKARNQGFLHYLDVEYRSKSESPTWPETEEAAKQRATAAVKTVVENHREEIAHRQLNIVFVTHAFAVPAVVEALTGQRVPGGALKTECASLTLLTSTPDSGWLLKLRCDTRHLRVCAPPPRPPKLLQLSGEGSSLQFMTPPPSEIGVRRAVRRRPKAALGEQIAANAADIRRLELELVAARQLRGELMQKRVRMNRMRSLFCGMSVEHPLLCRKVCSFLPQQDISSLLLTSKLLKACVKDASLSSLLVSSYSTTFISSHCTSVPECAPTERSVEVVTTFTSPDKSSVLFRAKKLFDDDEEEEEEEEEDHNLALLHDLSELEHHGAARTGLCDTLLQDSTRTLTIQRTPEIPNRFLSYTPAPMPSVQQPPANPPVVAVKRNRVLADITGEMTLQANKGIRASSSPGDGNSTTTSSCTSTNSSSTDNSSPAAITVRKIGVGVSPYSLRSPSASVAAACSGSKARTIEAIVSSDNTCPAHHPVHNTRRQQLSECLSSPSPSLSPSPSGISTLSRRSGRILIF